MRGVQSKVLSMPDSARGVMAARWFWCGVDSGAIAGGEAAVTGCRIVGQEGVVRFRLGIAQA